MSDITIDKQKLKKILSESYNISKNYKNLNVKAVDQIIKLLKEELKNDED